MSSTPPPLLDAAYFMRLPTPLAHALQTLAREMVQSGVHTTADELVACIEALFSLLGRLWVAEYLAAGAPDAHANRMLHDRVISGGGRVLGGAWLGIARALRSVFLARGLRPVAGGLLDVDFGDWGDDAHPFARLSTYRNSFAHGSFQSVLEDIHTHRDLFADQLGRLPFLIEQPFVMDTGDGVVALRGEVERVARPSIALEPMRPALVGADGRVVDLYPLAVGRDEAGTLGLAWPGKKDGGPRDIVKHVRFEAWFARYQRELEGDVEAMAACLGEPLAWPEASVSLAERGAARTRGLLLVETPPGAPRAGVLAGWADAGTVRWRVRPGDLMGSGLVFVKALLRGAEASLGLERGHFALVDTEGWRAALGDASRQLDAGGRVLRVAIEDLHLGDAPARPGEPAVLEVWRSLAGGAFLALGGAVRGWALRPIAHDVRVSLGFGPASDAGAVRDFVSARAGSALHREVLALLCERSSPLDLFEACDVLEAARGDGAFAFEPAVERALWDLAPLLTLGRDVRETEGGREQVRTFALLDPTHVRAALETNR